MTILLNVILFFGLQAAPAPQHVVVGFLDGQKLLVEDPQFSGFIETHGGESALRYQQDNFHGDLAVTAIARVDFEEYKKGKPFGLTVTLKNGQKLQVHSEGPKFLVVKGKTDSGTVTIKHPDPTSGVVRLTTSGTDRKRDLKIMFLEFQ